MPLTHQGHSSVGSEAGAEEGVLGRAVVPSQEVRERGRAQDGEVGETPDVHLALARHQNQARGELISTVRVTVVGVTVVGIAVGTVCGAVAGTAVRRLAASKGS